MSKPQMATLLIACLLCAVIVAYPPFEDMALMSEGPTFAPIWKWPPPNQPKGGYTIDKAVLSGELALVMVPAAVLLLGLRRPPIFNRAEQFAVCLGAALMVVRILYPPEIGGGPLGIHVGTGILFQHSRESYINTELVDTHLIGIGFVTMLALYVLNRFNKERGRTI